MERSNAAQKLLIDFPGERGRGARMDDDDHDLIAQLCTRIGMIMEDASPTALSIGAMDQARRRAAIAELSAAAAKISSLLAAAQTLLR